MRIFNICICAAAALAAGAQANAQVLYASSASGGSGELYILDPTTGGMIKDVGALNDVTGLNYGITGLAFDPVSGVLFGSVANSNPATAAKLVTVDPNTAAVTVIGAFNAGNSGSRAATMADLTFDPTTDILYGVGSVGGPRLYSINTATGAASLTGAISLTSTTGGGVASDAAGNIYGAPTGASRFVTYNKTTGAISLIGALSGLPFPSGAVNSMCFDSSGTLYAMEGDETALSATHLITINTSTGAATDVGPSLARLDAIAFRPASTSVPEPGTMAYLFGPGVLGLLGFARRRRS